MTTTICIVVALRKESVDRNGQPFTHYIANNKSLSARRAWIEICDLEPIKNPEAVALRKESVDRNQR